MVHFVFGRVVHSLSVDRIVLASLDANSGRGRGLLVNLILLVFLPLSGRSPDMTIILLTGT